MAELGYMRAYCPVPMHEDCEAVHRLGFSWLTPFSEYAATLRPAPAPRKALPADLRDGETIIAYLKRLRAERNCPA